MDDANGLRSTWTAKSIGCLFWPIAITLTIVFWSDIRATAWYWQAAIVVGYVLLLRTLRSEADLRAEADSHLRAAGTLISKGRFAEALKHAESGLAESPDNPLLLYAKGKSLYNMQRKTEAERAWLKALELDPSHGLSAADLGTLYMNDGEHMKAAEQYEQARAAGVSGDWFDRNLRRLSNNLAAKGTELAKGVDPVQAAGYFRRATDFGTPDHPFEHNLRLLKHQLTEKGIAAEKAESYELALLYSDARLSLEADLARAHAWKASHLASLGRYDEAVKHWRRCCQVDPTYRPEIIEKLIADAEEALAESGKLTTPPDKDLSLDLPNDEPLLWRKGEYAFRKFHVRRVVRGGMGHVYCCWSASERMFFALKAVHLDKVLDPKKSVIPGASYRDLFKEEAKIWLRLGRHPNIVTLYTVEDFEHSDLVLCMEYIPGRPDVGPTLRDHLTRRGRLPVAEAVQVAIGVCDAMQFSYERSRLVHRDLKPENVFVTDTGLTKVGDFGLAVTEEDAYAIIAGTGPYVAPELADRGARPRTTMDIYATGVILYEMLTDRRPIRPGDDCQDIGLVDWVRIHREQTPLSLTDAGIDFPPCLPAIVMTCLARAPAERYQNFADLRRALASCAGQAGIELAGPDVSAALDGEAIKHYNLGISLHNLGQHEKALSEYRLAVSEEPFKSQISKGWCNMGQVLATLRRFDEAKMCFDKAVQINPNDTHALFGIANTLQYTGRFDEALKAARELLEIDPTYWDAYTCEGWAHLKSGRAEAGRAAFQKVLSFRSDDPFAMTGMACYAANRRLFRKAKDLLERALIRRTDYAEAHSLLCDVLRELGEVEKGLPHAEMAVALEPDHAGHRVILGMTLSALGDNEQAARQLEIAVQLAPDMGLGRFALASAYSALGRMDEAIQCARNAVRLGCGEARELVGELEKRPYGHKFDFRTFWRRFVSSE